MVQGKMIATLQYATIKEVCYLFTEDETHPFLLMYASQKQHAALIIKPTYYVHGKKNQKINFELKIQQPASLVPLV